MLVFGGHGPDFEEDITGFRTYDSGTGQITSTTMQSGRWYPTPVTLPDGKVCAGRGAPGMSLVAGELGAAARHVPAVVWGATA